MPQLPQVESQNPIHLQPQHQFYCLAAVGHAIRHIDNQFRNWLGRDGLIYLAAYHTLLADTPSVATEAYKLPEKVINHALVTRYAVIDLDQFEVAPILSELGVWQALPRKTRRSLQIEEGDYSKESG